MPWTQDEKDKIRMIEEDITNMSKAFADIKIQFFELKLKIDEVYFAIIGSPISKDGGLIKRINETERTIDIWDKKMQKISLKTNILWTLVGMVGAAFVKIVYDILIKK